MKTRLLVASLGFASVLGLPAQAAAQEDRPEAGDCTPHPIAGTVGYGNALHATQTNAQVFGAAAFAERKILPALETAEFGGWSWELSTIFGATRIPTVNTGSNCESRFRYGTQALDLLASSAGLVVKTEYVGVFWAGNVTGSLMNDPGNDNRLFNAYGFAGAGVLSGYVPVLAPVFSRESGPQRTVGDFIVGAQGMLPGAGAIRLGYVGSTGLYTNVSVTKLKLFATAILTDAFSELGYLKSGFDYLTISPELGAVTVYGRKLDLKSTTPVNAAGSVIESFDPTSTSFWTAHLEQLDLLEYMDLRIARAFSPTPLFHEIRAGVHTSMFQSVRSFQPQRNIPAVKARIARLEKELADAEEAAKDDAREALEQAKGELSGFEGQLESEFPVGISFTAGKVELPRLPQYGVLGGSHFSYEFELTALGNMIEFSVKRNSPETLSIFPYAQGAIHTYLGFNAIF